MSGESRDASVLPVLKAVKALRLPFVARLLCPNNKNHPRASRPRWFLAADRRGAPLHLLQAGRYIRRERVDLEDRLKEPVLVLSLGDEMTPVQGRIPTLRRNNGPTFLVVGDKDHVRMTGGMCWADLCFAYGFPAGFALQSVEGRPRGQDGATSSLSAVLGVLGNGVSFHAASFWAYGLRPPWAVEPYEAHLEDEDVLPHAGRAADKRGLFDSPISKALYWRGTDPRGNDLPIKAAKGVGKHLTLDSGDPVEAWLTEVRVRSDLRGVILGTEGWVARRRHFLQKQHKNDPPGLQRELQRLDQEEEELTRRVEGYENFLRSNPDGASTTRVVGQRADAEALESCKACAGCKKAFLRGGAGGGCLKVLVTCAALGGAAGANATLRGPELVHKTVVFRRSGFEQQGRVLEYNPFNYRHRVEMKNGPTEWCKLWETHCYKK